MFLKNPYLPKSKVTFVAIGEKYFSRLKQGFDTLGIEIVTIPSVSSLPKEVSSHADLSICPMKENTVMVQKNLSNETLKVLRDKGFVIMLSNNALHKKYPQDTILNCVFFQNKLFCALKHTDEALISFARKEKLEIVNIKQGYVKCSIAFVSENAIITSDLGIGAAFSKLGCDVLLIQPGFFSLEGYSYGFIGGCCGLIDKNVLAFSGTLKGHPDEKNIDNFLKKHSIEAYYLTDEKAFDIGSIIPLCERGIEDVF